MSTPTISDRKRDHLELCADQDVEARAKTNLLDAVELFHSSLPEVDVDAIDLSVEFLGRQLQAPLLITGMTGGAPEAERINRELALVAQEMGLAFGVGSQRAMARDRALLSTYQVRDVAPDICLLGNIGAVQVAAMSTDEVEDLVGSIGADALCVHLNPGQELIQPEGDRDFRGCIDAIARLVEELSVPVIAKETGCGLSPGTLNTLQKIGVGTVDTSGAGGTTWIGVEAMRAPADQQTLGELFWDWGVPTAASIVYARRRDLQVIGSGGLRTGYDAARAIALGADIAGMALPWLRACYHEGAEGARAFGAHCTSALRTTMALTGSATLDELRQAPRMIGPRLERWLAADTCR
ncbi:type 2 isopentenyl-diphosphate Delta-isomerase [Lujinxingia litoralis]|uniref:Isopentenyl-diphosphate delta-isomerase n=1 Tax=Lujinxingia litoralis TaxID=2211119 RepID=A0A328C8W4_9DELT|nr:type 2 isopentenyl-diphosphate Delta-isomerase [Lujinxingia litoralis]RAL23786.1 type 2 isopentenyl-diphosphate Delta-isomerase [Lujinxingia litoralis]